MKKRCFKRRGDFVVYILECSDGTFYTGSTNDLDRRFNQHNSGKGGKYTKSRNPVKLIWCKNYRNFKAAFLEEIRIKTLTRKQKETLIKLENGSPALTRKRNQSKN